MLYLNGYSKQILDFCLLLKLFQISLLYYSMLEMILEFYDFLHNFSLLNLTNFNLETGKLIVLSEFKLFMYLA